MVQLIYYENRGQCCDKILKSLKDGIFIELEACESWPYPTVESRWYLTFYPFTTRWCKVVQMTCSGIRRFKTIGRVFCTRFDGAMFITGKFKHDTAGKLGRPDFCLYLTTLIEDSDFHNGFLFTGMLERGDRRKSQWESTHSAIVRRKGY